jgi:glucose dehydrogenase
VSVLAVATVVWIAFSAGGTSSHAQNGRTNGPIIEWPTYGGNPACHRYSPADQITNDTFNQLRIAWPLKTDFGGEGLRARLRRPHGQAALDLPHDSTAG